MSFGFYVFLVEIKIDCGQVVYLSALLLLFEQSGHPVGLNPITEEQHACGKLF